jgi:hypothetical protein
LDEKHEVRLRVTPFRALDTQIIVEAELFHGELLAKVLELGSNERHRRASKDSPLTPALMEFIDRVIVPVLVREYLTLENGLADERSDAAHSERYTAARELRTVRP